MNAQDSTSTRPYLIRAIYEWCTDNGFTPYLAVRVDKTVQVPREYVNDGEIVLNVSYDATSGLQMGNEFIEFKARFGGKPREIMVPVERVLAIYARESGQGMSFPVVDGAVLDAQGDAESVDDSVEANASDRVVQLVPTDTAAAPLAAVPRAEDDDGDKPRPPSGGGRPSLKLVK
ncbi:ClpXP protease specificity-enhancing factor [Comamonas terrigena]|uniref:ClpXP protease specificity-enhancing factor n=1 Tax=Comamonas terrigena TaxID=32013 RepID=UPI0028A0D4D2|nr:ClpXP protease specificity-enhancing factor [Comamonas terrigena]